MTKQMFVSLMSIIAVSVVVLHAPAPANASCGDFDGDGSVTASDALGTLGVAVGAGSCVFARCDVDKDGSIAASDALEVLRSAVGQPVALDCPGVAATNIADLPRATAPVVSDVAPALVVGDPASAVATTGIRLGDVDSNTFDQNSSLAACQTTNLVKEAVNSAAQADLILCYVQNVFESVDDGTIDIYDGSHHVFALDFGPPPPGGDPEEFGGPSSVKMKLVRDEDDTIVEFEMFMCGDSGQAEETQTEYVRQVIDGADFSMVSKGFHADPEGQSAHEVHVTGDLNDAAAFSGTKTVEMAYTGTHGNDNHSGEAVFVQGADFFSVDTYSSGTYEHDGGQGTHSDQVNATGELLDSNTPGQPYDIGDLALGHGAAKARFTGTWQQDQFEDEWDHTEVEGWNGDTRQVDPVVSADFVDNVTGAQLVPVAPSVTVEFSPEESYGCDEPVEMVVPVDQVALDQACSGLDLGHDWINCWDIIGNDGGGEGEGQGICEQGPDCAPDGFCDGPNCCGGPDCGGDGVCTGPDCCQGEGCNGGGGHEEGFCEQGPDCAPDGFCDGPNCCGGPDCGGDGVCTGPDCCQAEECNGGGHEHGLCEQGPDCAPDGICDGPDCCGGPDCGGDGQCTGPDCCQFEECNQPQ